MDVIIVAMKKIAALLYVFELSPRDPKGLFSIANPQPVKITLPDRPFQSSAV